MNPNLINRRRAETAQRVYRLQAERLEKRRAAGCLDGTEEECVRAEVKSVEIETEYLRALEAHFVDSEVLLTGAAGRSAA